MLDDVDQLLTSTVARILQSDATLTREQAVARTNALLSESQIAVPPDHVSRLAQPLSRHAVPNPVWLEAEGVETHFYMASSRPGYLKQLVERSADRHPGLSQFIVYGDWDTVLLFQGRQPDANRLAAALASSTVEHPLHFKARALLYYRHPVAPLREPDVVPEIEILNALIRDFDGDRSARAQLLSSGHLLGSTWTLEEGGSPFPVAALLGIELRGKGNLDGPDVTAALTAEGLFSDTVVHLFEIDQGRPFHYLAYLGCQTTAELDAVTTLLGSISFGAVRLEGTTFVVANSTESLPVVGGSQTSPTIALGLDLSPLVVVAERAILDLPSEAQRSFAELTELQQLSVVKSVVELQSRLDDAAVSSDTKARFASALATFLRECAGGSGSPNLTGAIAEAVTTLEGLVRKVLSKLAYACFGNDPGRIQTELRLPTKSISKLSLGKVVNGLQVARSLPEFAPYQAAMDDSTLDRLTRILVDRNQWLHDAADVSYGDIVEEARRIIVVALDLAEWAERLLAQVRESTGAPEVAVAAARERASVFISHASTDSVVAERIAAGLKPFGIQAWYSGWEFSGGESIVERIGEAIARSDVLIVLLSPESVESRWVRRELNSALAAQLAGEDITVIPIVIAPCEVPPLLADIFHLDFSIDFEDGLLRLIGRLRER